MKDLKEFEKKLYRDVKLGEQDAQQHAGGEAQQVVQAVAKAQRHDAAAQRGDDGGQGQDER